MAGCNSGMQAWHGDLEGLYLQGILGFPKLPGCYLGFQYFGVYIGVPILGSYRILTGLLNDEHCAWLLMWICAEFRPGSRVPNPPQQYPSSQLQDVHKEDRMSEHIRMKHV